MARSHSDSPLNRHTRLIRDRHHRCNRFGDRGGRVCRGPVRRRATDVVGAEHGRVELVFSCRWLRDVVGSQTVSPSRTAASTSLIDRRDPITPSYSSTAPGNTAPNTSNSTPDNTAPSTSNSVPDNTAPKHVQLDTRQHRTQHVQHDARQQHADDLDRR